MRAGFSTLRLLVPSTSDLPRVTVRSVLPLASQTCVHLLIFQVHKIGSLDSSHAQLEKQLFELTDLLEEKNKIIG